MRILVGNSPERLRSVWHNAAAVGPFHPRDLYFKVNYEGTLVVIRACKEAGVKKIVMSSSPSTRFDGSDVDGLSEAQLPPLPQPRYLQTYAETKAMGEKALTDACCPELMTCAVAPHQVYGPRDNLFLPNLLEAAGSGRLRVFGKGLNRICFTYVDNYAHGLIIAERVSVCRGAMSCPSPCETPRCRRVPHTNPPCPRRLWCLAARRSVSSTL